MWSALSVLLPTLITVVVVALVAYAVIRRAVRDGIADARRLQREHPELDEEPAWKRWQRS